MSEKTDSKTPNDTEDIRVDAVKPTQDADTPKKEDNSEKKDSEKAEEKTPENQEESSKEEKSEEKKESKQESEDKQEVSEKKSESKKDPEPAKEESIRAEDQTKESSKEEDEEIALDLGKITGFFKGLTSDKGSEKTDTSKDTKKSTEEKKESSDDEDIAIDFSKVKSMFSGGDEPASKKQDDDDDSVDLTKVKSLFKSDDKQDKKDDDDEVSLDFSKMKGWFSSDKKKSVEASDDEISFDWQKTMAFAKKYSILLLLLIPLFISVDVRLQSLDYPITDNWARDSVISQIENQFVNQIQQQYPTLPPQNRDQLISQEVSKYLAANEAQVNEQIRQTSNFFKEHFKYPDGVTYMPDIDTYYWMRYAENILDHGHPGDVLKDGEPFDNKQLAPIGRTVVGDRFPSYAIAYLHKILGSVTNMNLVQTMSWYPVLVTALSTILVFLISLKVSNKIGAVFAGVIFSVHSTLLGRTLYGHSDSDAWVIFFPVLVTWLFFMMIDQTELKKSLIYGALAGLAVGIFSYAWIGWWYIFDFILAVAGILFLYNIGMNYQKFLAKPKAAFEDPTLRNLVGGILAFILISAVGVSWFYSTESFVDGVIGPLKFTSLKSPVDPNLWPNVLTTVAELNPGSFNQAVNSVGGKVLFYFSLVGIVLSLILGFLRSGEQGRKSLGVAILLALWFISSIYATTKGIRFTLLLAPAFAVAFGTTVGLLHQYLSKYISTELKVNKIMTSVLLTLIFGMFLISPVQGAYNSAKNDLPIVNDVWYNALTEIKTNSSEDAIITSWWDFGHHFKQIADRPVTFDGTTQRHAAAHWVGKALMTTDERESIGILQMLDCGSHIGYTRLNDQIDYPVKSVEVLNEMIMADYQGSQEILDREGIAQDKQEEILSLTKCAPPEGYFIASNDMIGKSGVWSHFGSWNFTRADVWFNVRKMDLTQAVEYMTTNYGIDKKTAEDLYFEVQAITTDDEANRWVSPWPGYAQETNCDKNSAQPELYMCQNGFIFNYTSKELYGFQGTEKIHPTVFAYPTKEGVSVVKYNESTVEAGLTLVPVNENRFRGVISSPELAGGMFTIMFHMRGHGLSYYQPLYHERGITGTEVFVYKAAWEGAQPSIEPAYVNILDQIDIGLGLMEAPVEEVFEVPTEPEPVVEQDTEPTEIVEETVVENTEDEIVSETSETETVDANLTDSEPSANATA